MKQLLTLIFLITASYTHAQIQYSDEYGRVTLDELRMTEYDLDKEAEALTIFEQGEYRFQREDQGNAVYFVLHMTVTSKIKILHEAGLQYAAIEIPYYTSSSDDTELVKVEGTTYNLLDGQLTKTPLGKGHVYDEVVRKNRSVKKIAFPNVQVGSVIELRYTVQTKRFFSTRPWRFQKTIPVRHSVLTLVANPFYTYAFILKGADKFDSYTAVDDSFDTQFLAVKYKNTTYKFVMNNLPAFRDEEFLPNTADYMIALYFEMSKYYSYSMSKYMDLMSTWPKLCTELLKDSQFGKYIDAAAKEGKNVIPSLQLDGKPDAEKVKLITQYVKNMYSWNDFYSIYASKKISAFLKEKTGSVGDINLYLVGLLKAAGLNARPVVLSIRSQGKVYKPYPFVSFFSYVIGMVEADGKTYYVDAVNPFTAFDEVAPESANVEGLVVAKNDAEQWVFVTSNKVSVEHNEVAIDIQPETGSTVINLTQTTQGNDALRQRTKYSTSKQNISNPYGSRPGAVLQSALVENFSEPDEPFIVHYHYTVEGGELSPEKIFLNPLENLIPADNPFKQTFRRHPVDLQYVRHGNFIASVKIPQGYEVEHLPQNKARKHSGLVYEYAACIEEGTVKVNAQYALASSFAARDYLLLKDFYGDIISKFSEAVVFRKKDVE